MSRTLKYEIPGIDWRRGPSDLDPSDAGAIFRPDHEESDAFAIEIGFGRGEFLLELAALNPRTNYLGVEISFKRVLKMARKVARAELSNVRLVEARAEVIIANLIPKSSTSEIWLNFSDPWPKDRHAPRRVVQPAFVRAAAQCLEPGGVLQIATDDAPYADQISAVLEGEAGLINLNAPDRWVPSVSGRPRTGYEIDWRAKGRPMHFFSYGCPLDEGMTRRTGTSS
jgi:tRNA (guanine-N7-)-methyltransferase